MGTVGRRGTHSSKCSVASALVTTSATDQRVEPLHSYKYFARLKECLPEGSLALLRVEQVGTHGGTSTRNRYFEQVADEYAFLLRALEGPEGAPRRN